MQRNLHKNKELQTQLSLQDQEILALKAELAKRSEETTVVDQISALEAELEKAKREREQALQDLNLVSREKEAFSQQADQLLGELTPLKEIYRIQENSLTMSIQKESFLESKIQQLNSEFSFKVEELATAEKDFLRRLEKMRDMINKQEVAMQEKDGRVDALTWKVRDLQIQRDKALAGLKDQEDRIALKYEFIKWSTRRNTLEQVKVGIDDIDAKILEAQELEAEARDNLPPSPQISPASLSGFFKEEKEPSNPGLDIPTPSFSTISPDPPGL